MAAQPTIPTIRSPKSTSIRRKSRKWRWIVGIAVALLAIAAIAVRIAIVRAQPILRTRVIETLSTRFKSRVELAELHVWVADGLHVDGKGLKIFGATDPNPCEAGVQPLTRDWGVSLPDNFVEPFSRTDARGHGLLDGLT